MSPEEYQRIKEAEKAHLRSLQKLKRAVREMERQKSIQQALGDMVQGAQDTLETHDDAVHQLALETARREARLELALAAADEPAEEEPDLDALDEELQQIRAQALLRQVKRHITASAVEPASAEPEAAPAPSTPEQDEVPDQPTTDELPEKTLGRMRPR